MLSFTPPRTQIMALGAWYMPMELRSCRRRPRIADVRCKTTSTVPLSSVHAVMRGSNAIEAKMAESTPEKR